MLFEASKMGVHHVEGHLNCIEHKLVLIGEFEHTKMYARIFVTGKARISYLSCLFGLFDSFPGSSIRKEAIGIFQSNVFMELPEVHVINLKTLKRLVELF